MNIAELATDSLKRVSDGVRRVLDGIDPDLLTAQLDGDTNTVAWLIWHLARVQDAQVAQIAHIDQVWTVGGWAKKFALELPDTDTGYGHTPEEVRAVAASAATLQSYYNAVEHQTNLYLHTLTEAALDQVIDTRWDPPVTLGVRLISILDDDLEHIGQAAFLRGILERRSSQNAS